MEVPDGLAVVEAGSGEVNASLTVARPKAQNRIEVALVEAAPPRGVADGRLLGDLDPGRIHPDRIDVFHVIPERVVHQRANQLGAGGHLRVIDRIDFELKHLTRVARVLRHEARMEATWPLAANHGPVHGVEALELARSPGNLRERQIADADAVGEPARVRHLVQGVHVDGAGRLAVALRPEGVDQEVEGLGELELLDAARIDRGVVVARNRIIGEELQRSPHSLARRAHAGCGHGHAHDGPKQPQRLRTHRRTSRESGCLRDRRMRRPF